MITSEQINDNKNRFLELINSISHKNMNKDLLIRQLTQSDFFNAPASCKYHGAYEGGLCEHCLAVYDNMVKLNSQFNYSTDDDSIKIVSLLHDMSKMNLYKSEIKNKKVYFDGGKKHDSMGNFDWVSEVGYAVKQPEDGRFILGNHEETAAYMVNTFIQLSIEEYSAILHHMGGMSWDSAQDNINDIYQKYPLALYLHIADSIDSYAADKLINNSNTY